MEVGPGEVVGLLGPNGAGKTTTFHIVVGLLSPDSGRVMLGKTDITNMPMYLRARAGISYLPQEPSIFKKLTVEENLMAILETRAMRPQERRQKVEQLVGQFGLEGVRHSQGYMLSGGSGVDVEIARSAW